MSPARSTRIASSPAVDNGPRDTWVDAAKGITILLVVLHHVVQALTPSDLSLTDWDEFDALLTAVRLPVFFLLAGLYARKIVHDRTRRLWRDRVGRFTYLFVLWSALYLPFYAVEAAVLGNNVTEEIRVRAGQLAIALSPMWFVLALAGFFAIARIARSIAPALQIALAGALSIAAKLFHFSYPFEKIWLLVFFLMGCYWTKQIRASMRAIRVDSVAGSKLLAPLRWIGAHTLPICLLHVPVLSLVENWPALIDIGVIAPAIVTIICTAGALLAWSGLRHIPGLFDPPTWILRMDSIRLHR